MRRKKEEYNVTSLAWLSLFSVLFRMNKRGMIGRMIGGFVAITIGVSLCGTVANQINAAFDCNSTYMNSTNMTYEEPIGSTDSFGGGGAEHFGGYDGKVVHKDFSHALGSMAIIQANETSPLLNPNCLALTRSQQTLLGLIPLFFCLGVLGVGIAVCYGALRDIGMV